VIDDDPAIRRIISATLEPLNHHVLHAKDGLEGVSIATAEIPDLIIIDQIMPYMDGIETVSRIREKTELKEVPVLVITTRTDRDTVTGFLDLGICHYFSKPIDCSALRKRVTQIMQPQPDGGAVCSSEQ
jgi:chemosensory pili system protein ChpA (sensor histidine kinase/response regulator)